MKLSRNKDSAGKQVGKMVRKSIFRALLTNPPLLIIVIVVVVGIVAYTLYSIDYQLTEIMKLYQSLSARTDNSKANFDKKLFYVSKDANGNNVITVGYSSEIAAEMAQQAADDAGYGGTPGGTYDFTAEDEELIAIFKQAGATDRKALGMLACFRAATELGMTPKQTLGLLGCAMCEGSPGLVQYGYPANASSPLWKSSASNPLYIDSASKLIAIDAKQSNSDKMGMGTAQWTNGRCRTYINLMKDMFDGQATISEDDLYLLDYNMYKNELSGSYRSLVDNIGDHDDTLDAILIFSWAKYEAGFGNYIDDNQASYHRWVTDENGDQQHCWQWKQLDARYPNVVALDALFTSKFGD